MGYWRVDTALIVENSFCGILESGYSVNCKVLFV